MLEADIEIVPKTEFCIQNIEITFKIRAIYYFPVINISISNTLKIS